MEVLESLLNEIRVRCGIRPGDTMPDSPDFGEWGQLLENLLYFDQYWLDKVSQNEHMRSRVTDTAIHYLGQLVRQKVAA